jgi:hypothetical protein
MPRLLSRAAIAVGPGACSTRPVRRRLGALGLAAEPPPARPVSAA